MGTPPVREAGPDGVDAAVGGALGMLQFIPYLPLVRAVGPLPESDPASVAHAVVDRVRDGVLVLDDLHWADDATLAILDRLAGRGPVPAATRPGDEGTEAELAATPGARLTEL